MKYEENMKELPWDLEKFRARPARWGEGGERRDMKHVNKTSFLYHDNNTTWLEKFFQEQRTLVGKIARTYSGLTHQWCSQGVYWNKILL